MLRCYACAEPFLVSHVDIERVKMLPGICPCPACRARPILEPGRESRLHRLVDFTNEWETVYRMEPRLELWHFSPECSRWPSSDFIELNTRPRLGHICIECVAKMRDDH